MECLYFIVFPHSLFKNWQDLEHSGFLRIRTSLSLWSAKPPSLKLSFSFSEISLTICVQTCTSMMQCLWPLWFWEIEHNRQRRNLLSPENGVFLSLWIMHFWSWECKYLMSLFFSHSRYQVTNSDVISECPIGGLPTYRAEVRDSNIFWRKDKTGLAEVMATP